MIKKNFLVDLHMHTNESDGSDCHGDFGNRKIGVPRIEFSKLRLDFI